MKKILFFALMISIGFNLYQMNSSDGVISDFSEKSVLKKTKNILVKDKVLLTQSSVSKFLPTNEQKCDCPSTADISPEQIKPKASEKAYDEKAIAKKLKDLKLKWARESQDFFYNELRLRDDQIERYNELVKMRKLEADEYFEPKMKNAQATADQENGELPYYIHSTEDTVFMGKLAERYDSLLHESFGDQAFSDYKKFINKHNKETIKEDIFFPIEF